MGYYCGIDLGDKITSIEIINKERKVIAAVEIETSAGAYAKFFKKYRSLTCIVEASPLAEWACREVEKSVS